jgi:haloalkane dehalogenase
MTDPSSFRHLYPFQSRFLDLNGSRCHYLDEGTGDPIVMVHGNPTWSFFFRSLIAALSPEYRTIAPDHIGCGLSEKPDSGRYDYRLRSRIEDFEVFLDRMGLTHGITLVLHDWGGMIGMAYAVKYPERIVRIVLMNTAAFLPPGGKKLPLRLRLARNTGVFSTVMILGFNLFAYGAARTASRKGLPGDVRRALTAPYDNWRNRIATLKFVQDIPICEKDPSYPIVEFTGRNLHRLRRHPMLICWGEHDFVFDADYLSEWRRRFPEAEVDTFPDAGHYLLEDAPDEIVRRVKRFLKENPTSLKF